MYVGRKLRQVETKPGWKTTEFWVTVAWVVGLVSAALAGAVAPRWTALASAISIGAYALARGLAKQGVPYVPPQKPTPAAKK